MNVFKALLESKDLMEELMVTDQSDGEFVKNLDRSIEAVERALDMFEEFPLMLLRREMKYNIYVLRLYIESSKLLSESMKGSMN